MTREEAIAILEAFQYISAGDETKDAVITATNMAIEALKARPTPKPDYTYEAEMVQRLQKLMADARPTDGDLISRQDAIDALEKAKKTYHDRVVVIRKMQDILEQLPSARPTESDVRRLYIKIYGDDEPSRKAEKLYQICDESERKEVAEWLTEYFPSARPQGEWLFNTNTNNGKSWNICSICGYSRFHPSDFCPNCGADMRGDDNEAD